LSYFILFYFVSSPSAVLKATILEEGGRKKKSRRGKGGKGKGRGKDICGHLSPFLCGSLISIVPPGHIMTAGRKR